LFAHVPVEFIGIVTHHVVRDDIREA
jgi:hypothetical protein